MSIRQAKYSKPEMLLFFAFLVLWFMFLLCDYCWPQTFTFPPLTDKVTVYWQHVNPTNEPIIFKVYSNNLNVATVQDKLEVVISRSMFPANSYVHVTASDLQGNESNPSPKVLLIFQSAPLPTQDIPYYALDILKLKMDWKAFGSVYSGYPDRLDINGPHVLANNPGGIKRSFSISEAGQYVVSFWAWGDTVIVNGSKIPLTMIKSKVMHTLSLPIGTAEIVIAAGYNKVNVYPPLSVVKAAQDTTAPNAPNAVGIR